MAHHIFYKFRQTSDFWYLTGWEEPDSVLVLEKDNSKRGYRMTLLVPPKDPDWEMWNGVRTGLDGARDIFGADEAIDVSKLATFLRSILTTPTSATVYVDLPSDVPPPKTSKKAAPLFNVTDSTGKSSGLLDYLSPKFSQYADLASLTAAMYRGPKADLDVCLSALYPGRASTPRPIQPLQHKIDTLRTYKSPAELALLRTASDISSRAHARAMRLGSKRSNLTEHAIVAAFEGQCAEEGSVRPAYVPVCAAGSAGLTVHYTANNRPLIEGEMVLLDAGCEYGGYAADITRTFPVSPGERNGKFSSAQRDLYSAVLSVEKDLVKRCSESGGETLASLHRWSCELLRGELKALGFEMRGGDLERLYPHYVGHPLGVDLHDTPTFDRGARLRSNMVITIEPGVYVPDSPSFPKHFRGMGVRVEDVVHVRKEDCVVLSIGAPKEVADVEACCGGLLEGVIEEARR